MKSKLIFSSVGLIITTVFCGLGRAQNKENHLIHLTTQEASLEQLPKIELQLSVEGTNYTPSLYPEAQTFLVLAGSSGGPPSIKIQGYKSAIRDAKELSAFLVDASRGDGVMKMNKAETIKIDNVSHPAVSFTLHELPPQRIATCALLYTAESKKAESVIVTYQISAAKQSSPNCDEILKGKSFQSVFKSMQIQFK